MSLKQNEVSCVTSKEKLSALLQTILSDFDKDLKVRDERYTEQFAEAIIRIRKNWSSRMVMKVIWTDYYGGKGSLAVNLGQRTPEYIKYLERNEDTISNLILNLFRDKIPMPDTTHVMTDDDWDKLFEAVEDVGSKYINELETSRPYISNIHTLGCIYRILIDQTVHGFVDGYDVKQLKNVAAVRSQFISLLEKVDAVDAGTVELGDSTLQLIHNVKTYF